MRSLNRRDALVLGSAAVVAATVPALAALPEVGPAPALLPDWDGPGTLLPVRMFVHSPGCKLFFHYGREDCHTPIRDAADYHRARADGIVDEVLKNFPDPLRFEIGLTGYLALGYANLLEAPRFNPAAGYVFVDNTLLGRPLRLLGSADCDWLDFGQTRAMWNHMMRSNCMGDEVVKWHAQG